MTSFNAILLLDFLSVRRQQQETHLQILRNEEIAAERSYNLLFSYLSHNQRLVNRETRNAVDEMTGILSSLSNLSTNQTLRGENTFTRRSTPSFTNRSTNTNLRATGRRLWPVTPRRTTATSWTFPINTSRTSFDNTPVPPTQAEIEIATVTSNYRDVSTNQLMCPIARTNFEGDDDVLKIIHCGHIFKKESLLTWFQTKQTCPICRHNITQNIQSSTAATASTTTLSPISQLPPI